MKYNTLTGEITGTPEEIVEFLKKYKQQEYINIPCVQLQRWMVINEII